MNYGTIKPSNFVVGDITDGPITQIVELGEYAEFECRTVRSAPRWIVTGMDLDLLERQYQEERGIRVILHRQMGSVDYISVLQVHAIEINNNTAIQCAVYSGDAQSEPAALLKIQGKKSHNENVI